MIKADHIDLPLPKILDVSYQIAESLAFLHNRAPKSLIHRDLKPSNIILSKRGELKLIDLGISKTLEQT